MKFCSDCAGNLQFTTPENDNRPRYICKNCQKIHYENPKVIVGTLPVFKEKVLLCKRAIQPQIGLWTLPAGFLEEGETLAEGALRETLEEATCTPDLKQLFTLINIPYISQIHCFFLSHLNEDNTFAPGEESLDVRLFDINDIPWDEIAFSSVRKTLITYIDHLTSPRSDCHIDTIKKPI